MIEELDTLTPSLPFDEHDLSPLALPVECDELTKYLAERGVAV